MTLQRLYNANAILSSTPVLVFVLYLLDLLYSLISFLVPPQISLIPFLFMKSFFYAGTYGVLLELISTEEVVPNVQNFLKNAKKYWPFCALITFALFLITIFISHLLPNINFTAYDLTAVLNVLPVYIIAVWLIQKKYPIVSAVINKTRCLDGYAILGIFTLSLAGLSVHFLLSASWIEANAFLRGLLNFTDKYINLLLFVYLGEIIIRRFPEIKEQFNAPEIYVINPMGSGVLSQVAAKYYRFQPPFFTVLKALSPKKYKFREFQMVIWNNRYFAGGKLVAITCFTSNSAEAYQLAKEFKKKGSTVIMGGPHVTFLSDEALDYCDSVVIGEAEGVWEEVIKDYENKSLKKKYFGFADERSQRIVHEELLQSSPEKIKDFIETARGCKFKCHFCTIPSLTNSRVRTKPVFEIVELLEKIKHKYRSIRLLDNNIYNDPVFAREFFKALIPLKIKWQSFCTIDIAKNDELLRLAKEGGCQMLIFGFEITENSEEKKQGGKFGMAHKYIEFTKKIKKAGIRVRSNFMFGFDSDSLKDLFRIWRFSFKLNNHVSIISFVTPIPGSKTYDDMLAQDRIVNLNWHNYNGFKQVISHKTLNPVFISFIFFPFISLSFILTTCRSGFSMLAGLLIAAHFLN